MSVSRYTSVAMLLVACAALIAVGVAWDAGRSYLFGGAFGMLVLASRSGANSASSRRVK